MCGVIGISCQNGNIVINKNGIQYYFSDYSFRVKNGDLHIKSTNLLYPEFVLNQANTGKTIDALITLITGCNCCSQTITQTPEKLYTYNYEIPTGTTVTLSDVMGIAATATGKAFIGVAGVDFDLKYLDGDSVDGVTQAATSDANESGPHGQRNLDSGGSSQMGIAYESQNPIIYRKHELAQSYTAITGSVAILKIEFIYI